MVMRGPHLDVLTLPIVGQKGTTVKSFMTGVRKP